MKIASRVLSVVLLSALALLNIGCGGGGGDSASPQETQFKLLQGAWTLTSANDGQTRTDFTNLVLNIGSGDSFSQDGVYKYSFTGTRPNPSPWPVSGTWKFGSDVTQDIIRDPNGAAGTETNMKYTVTSTGLIISFTVPSGSTGFAGGSSRTNSVSGEWRFEFQKQ